MEKRILYAEAVYDERAIQAVVDVLRNRRHTLMNGPAVREFEERIAALFGKESGVMVNSGSSANLLAVASLDLPAGSEVITPALTFSTTVAPLVQCRLVPAFVDVTPDSYVVDVEQVEAMIGPKTRALMIPNLLGNLPDWTALRTIASRHRLHVIEDSADTVGAQFDGRPTGQLSDISTTSFYASHVLTAGGFGGMVCSSDRAFAQRARLLRGWGRSSALTDESESVEARFNATVDGIPYDSKFVFQAVGFNFLPSEVGAAFGLAQCADLPSFIQKRIDHFGQLASFFGRHERWFILPRRDPRVRSGWLAFPLLIRPDAPFARRDLQIHFERNGIQTRTVFTGNILRQPGFSGIVRRERAGGYPNADAVMRGGLLVGCHHGLTSSDVERICDVYSQFAEKF
jgi:CDP-4-dehydro-6-deoxyglucose reductase, E1